MIPFVNLRAQYEEIRAEIEPEVLSALASTQYSLGESVAAFEKDFADFCQTKHAAAVNSGTSALHLALLACGIGPGDEVITVSFTFIATAAAIRYTGATPVFVDIRPECFTIDPDLIEAAVTSRTKAIVPVHLYGQAADMGPILDIARRYGLRVIEDAAQAHGSLYRGCPAGSLGDLGCFSFYPSKNLGACGEGGIVVSDSEELINRVKRLRDWGQSRRYHHDELGFNYRMDGIQGTALRVKLRHLTRWNEHRRTCAQDYAELLSGLPIKLPEEVREKFHVYHLYVVKSSRRDTLRDLLGARQIQTGIHYPIPIHKQTPFLEFAPKTGSLRETELAASEVFSLPMCGSTSRDDVRAVASALADVCGGA